MSPNNVELDAGIFVPRPGNAESPAEHLDKLIEAEADEVLRLLAGQLESVGGGRIPSITTRNFWPPAGVHYNAAVRPDPWAPSWHHLMPPPEGEWSAERRQQHLIVRKLPRKMRRLVTRIRNTHQRGQLVAFVIDELTRRASEQDRVLETSPGTELEGILYTPRIYTPGIDVESLVRSMALDSGFMLQLFKMAKAVKKHARDMNTWGGCPLPEGLPQLTLPGSGKITLPAWLGLTLAPLPHRPPEGLLLGLAQLFWIRVGIDTPRSLRVVDWGAGNSPFTRALAAVNPKVLPGRPAGDDEVCSDPEVKIKVDEVDVLGDAPEFTFASRVVAVPARVSYDFVLIQLPPPCSTRGGYRDRHKGLPSGTNGQAQLRDLGRLGIRRWSGSTSRIVQGILKGTRKSRDAAVLFPLFEVGAPSSDTVPEPMSKVLHSVKEALHEAGLTVTHDVEVSSTESCERWRCLIASSGKSAAWVRGSAEIEIEVEIEALLRALS
jgi:hypothetical protein